MAGQQKCANPFEALVGFFTKLTPEGRSSRADFWWVVLLVNFPCMIIFSAVSRGLNSQGASIIVLLVSAFLLWADYCLFTRRLHDIEWGDIRSKIWLVLQVATVIVVIFARANPLSAWCGLEVLMWILNTVIGAIILVAGCYRSKPAANAFGPVPYGEVQVRGSYANSSWMREVHESTVSQDVPQAATSGGGNLAIGKYTVPVVCGVALVAVGLWAINNMSTGEKDRYVVTKGDNGSVYRTDRYTGETDIIRGSKITRLKEDKIATSVTKEFATAKSPIKLRALDSAERAELTGRAGMGSYGFYSGTIYNGNRSVQVKEVVVGVSCLKGEETIHRKYIAKVDIAPLSSSDFSFRMIRGDEGEGYKYSWYIDSAKGHDTED